MNNIRLLLVGAVILVVVATAALFFSNKSSNKNSNQIANPTPATVQEETESTQAAVSITANGFEPSTLTVKMGTNVIWTNNNGKIATINSDIHPTHLLWPFLNLGSFDNGKSVSVVFEKKGTYTYHNHLIPTQTGTVIVK